MQNENVNAAAARCILAFWALEEASGIASQEGIFPSLECFQGSIDVDAVGSILFAE